jgi:hypothetical protein
MQYSIQNTYLFVYESLIKADYYPYLIANPNADLAVSFASNQSYPSRAEVEAKHFALEKETNSDISLLARENAKPVYFTSTGMTLWEENAAKQLKEENVAICESRDTPNKYTPKANI